MNGYTLVHPSKNVHPLVGPSVCPDFCKRNYSLTLQWMLMKLYTKEAHDMLMYIKE